jgi:cytosine/uracil/thiamine/allantoin permease
MNSNGSEDQPEDKITSRLSMVCTMIIILTFSRLLVFDILSMINDIITAFILFFTYKTRNSFMAIFCMLNGIIGFLVTIAKVVTDMSTFASHTGSYRLRYILVLIYAFIVYILVMFYSYHAIKIYGQGQSMLGPRSVVNSPTNNYGAVPSNNYGPVSNNQNTGGFQAFSGKGTKLGGEI